MSDPFISHSEITDAIYIVCGTKKYNVTEQVIRSMRETGRLEQQRPHGEWVFVQRGKFVDMVCPFCKDVCVDGIAYNYSIDEVKETIESDTFSIHGKQGLPNFCQNCGADMRKGDTNDQL